MTTALTRRGILFRIPLPSRPGLGGLRSPYVSCVGSFLVRLHQALGRHMGDMSGLGWPASANIEELWGELGNCHVVVQNVRKTTQIQTNGGALPFFFVGAKFTTIVLEGRPRGAKQAPHQNYTSRVASLGSQTGARSRTQSGASLQKDPPGMGVGRVKRMPMGHGNMHFTDNVLESALLHPCPRCE